MVSGIRSAAASALMALLWGLLATATPAHAQTTDYSFTLYWQAGDLAGTTSTGSLSFDSALAVPNAMYFEPDLLSSFSFNLRGSFYDLSSIQTGRMEFDGYGELLWLDAGTHCSTGYCKVVPGDTRSFYVYYLNGFNAATSLPSGAWAFASQVTPVPEPGVAALWAVGLVLGGVVIRRRGRSEAVHDANLDDRLG